MALVAPRLYYSILSSTSAGLLYPMPSLDPAPSPSSSNRHHARTTDRSSSSSSMSSSLNPAQSSYYPLATSFHTPQPHPSYYNPSAVQNREKLREELVHDSTRLTSLIRRLETSQQEPFAHQNGSSSSGSNSNDVDMLWLEAYKILFLIRSSLRRTSSSAADDAIQHWSRHIYLFQRLAHLNDSQDSMGSSTVAQYNPQRSFAEDMPTTVCRLASVLSDVFSQSFHGGRALTRSHGRENTR